MIGVRLVGGAIDLTGWKPPTRNRIDRHGDPATEKLPTQRSVYMLNPAGHGVWVALHCGSGNRSANDATSARIMAEKMSKGFLPFGRCPQTLDADVQRHLPQNLRGKEACRAGADGQPIGMDHPCKCIVETERIRTIAHNKKMAEGEARFRDPATRERIEREALVQATLEQNRLLAEQKAKDKK